MSFQGPAYTLNTSFLPSHHCQALPLFFFFFLKWQLILKATFQTAREMLLSTQAVSMQFPTQSACTLQILELQLLLHGNKSLNEEKEEREDTR